MTAGARYVDLDLGDKPFQPVAATVFPIAVIAVTTLLCRPPA